MMALLVLWTAFQSLQDIYLFMRNIRCILVTFIYNEVGAFSIFWFIFKRIVVC